jgi:hypothetical protein
VSAAARAAAAPPPAITTSDAASRPERATATPAAMRSASSGSFTARADRTTSSAGTSAAPGASRGRARANPGDQASTPTRRASDRPGTARSASAITAGFQVTPNRWSNGISGGTPASQVDRRWVACVAPTTTHAGPNGRVPAVQRARAPVA